MTLEQFIDMQTELFFAFGWLARWWLIMFAVFGTALGAFMFFLSIVSNWLDSK